MRDRDGRGIGIKGARQMWTLADRMVKAISDVTVGTVIVLVHVALADRNRRRSQSLAALPPDRSGHSEPRVVN